MSMLYLVRHGQASAGTHDYDRLSPIGQRQSELLGQWWQSQGFIPDAAHHGSLVRQRHTASLALSAHNNIECQEHSGLNEYDHRVIDLHYGGGFQSDNPESMTFEDYAGIMAKWRDSDSQSHLDNAGDKQSIDSPTPGDQQAIADKAAIEPWSDFKLRGWQTIRALHKPGEKKRHEVYFTSGGVIATLLSTILDLDFAHTIDAIWRIRNTSITTLHFDGEIARLVDFNTVPHLQAHSDPTLITLI
jgi:broad specificity phosphatase PhoE